MLKGTKFLFGNTDSNGRGGLMLEKMKGYFIRGYGDQRIARIFDCHHTSIRYWRKKFGYTPSSELRKEKKLQSLMPHVHVTVNRFGGSRPEVLVMESSELERNSKTYTDYLRDAGAKAPREWKKFYSRKIFSVPRDTIV